MTCSPLKALFSRPAGCLGCPIGNGIWVVPELRRPRCGEGHRVNYLIQVNRSESPLVHPDISRPPRAGHQAVEVFADGGPPAFQSLAGLDLQKAAVPMLSERKAAYVPAGIRRARLGHQGSVELQWSSPSLRESSIGSRDRNESADPTNLQYVCNGLREYPHSERSLAYKSGRNRPPVGPPRTPCSIRIWPMGPMGKPW